ncbi:hypothetical protein BMF94_0073 [Rhodotorula taiwanensis]|uniref:F-box domain-containing protein n=1 Tax=Rhodotorula taiwanensis TaxID=741276 RepID=A0A2S5BJ79_9BASI|nr:hypothetical protein BMF94_0073 [Rhodotorula taiwanensis]
MTLIAQLPAEILLHIFALARDRHDAEWPQYDDPSIYVHFRRRLNPVVSLSHVSRAWRTLVISTPHLWSTLYLDGEIDGDRAEAKAMFWTRRAALLDDAQSVRGDGIPQLPGVTTLVLTRIQDWAPDDLKGLCEALELLHLGSLKRVRFSWMGGGLSTDENRQLQSTFRLLVPSAPTLASLTVFTPSHLRIGFSLPRLGHTFSALEELEIRSCKIALPASDANLVPGFLPRYAGESDWNPLTALKRLVLVGPIWRLRYQDGTIASPVVSSADLPALEYAHLGSTAPPVFWNLLSHRTGSLRHLHLEDHFDHPHQPEPDLLLCFANLHTLSLTRSASLGTRILEGAVRLGTAMRFPVLETLTLAGAQLRQAHLDLLDRAPSLRRLDLSDTTVAGPPPSAANPVPLQLSLPTLPKLERLALLHVEWIGMRDVVGMLESSQLPALRRIVTESDLVDLDRWKLRERGIALYDEDGQSRCLSAS